MAVFDTQFLIYLFDPDANMPNDPKTDGPVADGKERIEHLVKKLDQEDERVFIPTPVLSEYLIGARDAGVSRLQLLQNSSVFRFADFDARAAVELATLMREALDRGDKKSGSGQSYQKIKFDHQIVAIARVCGENVIYSGDLSLHSFASQAGLSAVSLWELEPPPRHPQSTLDF